MPTDERYGVGENRPEAQHKVCRACKKRIGRGFLVFLHAKYFHADCFFAAEDHGATPRQVRHLRAVLASLETLAPLWKERHNAN